MIKSVNPKILIWARERYDLTQDDLAIKLKKDIGVIKNWEEGKLALSYSQLEYLADSVFKIPIAVFFFPSPPDIDDPKKNFRRLPDYEFERISLNTWHKIHQAQRYQNSLIELMDNVKQQKMIHKDISANGYRTIELASVVREYLGLSLSDQYKFKSTEQAFKGWRYHLEKAGIYAFKDSFQDKFISGFCLLDESYPIIMINNSNSFSRQIFSLIHELGHILFNVNGISDVVDKYIDFMDDENKRIEYSCNKFAAELLVPSATFEKDIRYFQEYGIDGIKSIADKYSISREVVLRKMLDNNVISSEIYSSVSIEWNKDFLRTPNKSTGGNYYLTQLSYIGQGYAKLAFELHKGGMIAQSDLANAMNVKARNLGKLESNLRY